MESKEAQEACAVHGNIQPRTKAQRRGRRKIAWFTLFMHAPMK